MMTPDEYALEVIAKINSGMFDPSSGTGLYKAIVKAVSAAVQAEREACAKRIEELADDGERAVAIMAELGYETHESYLAKALRLGSSAIRARNV